MCTISFIMDFVLYLYILGLVYHWYCLMFFYFEPFDEHKKPDNDFLPHLMTVGILKKLHCLTATTIIIITLLSPNIPEMEISGKGF